MMYGVSGKELLVFLALVMAVGGAGCIAAEHGIAWLNHHVTVGVH